MSESFSSVLHLIHSVFGWIVGRSWMPPAHFEFIPWLFSPSARVYGAILLGLVVLELVVPHKRRPFDRESLLSGIYFLFSGKVIATVMILTPSIRTLWLDWNLPSLHLDRILPLPLYIIAGVLAMSFADYWAHRWLHRVPILWHIHKIHHSPTNLNWMTRYHMHFAMDILHVPMILSAHLLLGTKIVAPFGLILLTIDYFQHANVKFDFGKLNYIFATPQVHRFHHSTDPAHYDKNFAGAFVFWDQLFGTFYYDPENPPVQYGLSEEIPRSFVKQQFLPLLWIARDARDWLGRQALSGGRT